MCDTEAALLAVGEAGVAAAVARCGDIPASRWRGECVFRVAEAQSRTGDVAGAWQTCGGAGEFARMCLGHAAWLQSGGLVPARPADPEAQAQVDALLATLPELPAARSGPERWGVAEIVRAAAWHGIYAGAGEASPVAARSASAEDAPLARGAFAWEASRLLAGTGGEEDLPDRLLAVWREEVSAPAGSPLPEACWSARLVPRFGLGYAEARTVRTWSGGERFVSAVPEADLRIAAVEARWAAGVDLSPALAAELLADPDPAVALTAARLVGAQPGVFPDLSLVPADRPELQTLALGVREATRTGATGRSVVGAGGARCGE